MKEKHKESWWMKYVAVCKAYFGIGVFLVAVLWTFWEFSLPDERDTFSAKLRPLEVQWYQVTNDGSVPVEVPGKLDAEYGEVVTLTTTLPQNIVNGDTLRCKPIWQSVDVYVDGEMRVHYDTSESRPFGTNSAMRYIFVELTAEDAGKSLTCQFSSNSKYTGVIPAFYIGDMASLWVDLVKSSGIRSLIAVFLLLFSLFCIIVTFILKLVYKKTLSLTYLAWTLFFAAAWMLSESDFRQLLFRNISALSNITYWSLMLIPFPLMIYIDDVQGHTYKKIYVGPLAYSAIVFLVCNILQMLDIAQFVELLPFIHGGLVLAILVVLATIGFDAIKRRIKSYIAVGIGISGMMLTAIIEMVFYYSGALLSMGTLLGVGLMFLLIMAIIKTGQDLFSSEKNKQEAIAAREAQAKFLANMSHEIRTPINAIIGMNEMILRENESSEIADYAMNIQSASKMLLGLVNDVLDFSKIESGQLELVEDTYHLGALLQDAALLMNTRAAGKPISTKLDINPALPSKYKGDELRIKQILTNLLSNAVKYTKEGSVTLKATYTPLDKGQIMLVFSVIDTGIGIKKEDLPRLFDGFKRLELEKNRNIQGTGLGLNIAKQLVTQMRGSIAVDSVYGEGSTFTVSIPQLVIDKQPLGDLKESVDASRKEKGVSESLFVAPDAKILIVDDNAMNLSLMKGLLKRTQMQVDTAISGEQCLEMTKDKKYDIIFMDHMMPEMDGIETLKHLRSNPHNPNCGGVVIALTANAIAGCKEMYLGYGFDDYFAKPIQADKLEELIVHYLPKELVNLRKRPVEEAVLESAVQKMDEELLTIDHALGLSYCMDMEDFYEEMCGEFCKQATGYIPQLEKFFQDRDWAQYAIVVHALKSNSLNIGASAFSQLSLRHEHAAKEKNAEFLEKEYEVYVEALRALIDKLQKK